MSEAETSVTTDTADGGVEGTSLPEGHLAGHAGELAVAVARAHGVETMFTLSGAHVFPMYDGAVTAEPPMRLLDVRHEQTAAFAAEATGKLTRVPGLAVLTAGPGVTNGVSAIAQAQFAGSPMVVVGGRAPQNRWGSGSLQELDQPPILASVSKQASTLPTAADVLAAGRGLHGGALLAPRPGVRRRADGRVLRLRVRPRTGPRGRASGSSPTPTRSPRSRRLLAQARRPVLVLGTDVWADGAEDAALRLVEGVGVPTLTNGMGRGVVPGGHPLLVTKARSVGARQGRPRRRGRHAPRLPPRPRSMPRVSACTEMLPGTCSGHSTRPRKGTVCRPICGAGCAESDQIPASGLCSAYQPWQGAGRKVGTEVLKRP